MLQSSWSAVGYDAFITIKAEEGIGRWAWLLLYFEVVIKRYLLNPGHQALTVIHCKIARQMPCQQPPVNLRSTKIRMNKSICHFMLKWSNKDQYVGTQMLIFQLNDLVVVLKGQVYCKSKLICTFQSLRSSLNLLDEINKDWSSS